MVVLCVGLKPPVWFCFVLFFLSADERTSGSDVSPPATTTSYSAPLSLTDLEESSDVSARKK